MRVYISWWGLFIKKMRWWTLNLHLHTTDECPKEPHHAQELHSAQVFHGVLLTDVRHCVQSSTDQHESIPQQHMTTCSDRDTHKAQDTEIKYFCSRWWHFKPHKTQSMIHSSCSFFNCPLFIFCTWSKIPTEFGKRSMRRKTKISIKHNQGVMKLCPYLPPIIKYLLEPWSLPASRSAPTIAPTPSKHTATAIKCNGL